MSLTDKQERFCLEYIKDLNATQAAIRAGYSEKTAKEIGCENLTKPNISARIDEMKKEIQDEVRFEVKEWVSEHLNIINTTPLEALESTGSGFTFKDIDDFPEHLRASIKKISFKKGVGMEIELYDKQKSLDALGKWMGAYQQHNEQKKPGALTEDQIINELERIRRIRDEIVK